MQTPILDELKGHVHRTWWALVLRGLFALAMGIFIFARPLDSVATLALVIALWALFAGVVETVHALELRSVMKHWWILLLSGLVGIGFGIAALDYYPALSLTFAVVWVAWWLMLTGVLGISAALMQRTLGAHWGWNAAFGVLSVIAGVYALLAPPVTLVALMGLIGGFAIVIGIALLVGAFRIRSVVHA
jgi:uncharacterized membrane protein HdeD (DUF308 family)